jgi:hypothetical protein
VKYLEAAEVLNYDIICASMKRGGAEVDVCSEAEKLSQYLMGRLRDRVSQYLMGIAYTKWQWKTQDGK